MLNSKTTVLMVLLTLLCVGTTWADEPQPWTTYMSRADYLMRLGRFPEARAMYQSVCSQFPGTVAVDRAVVGIAKTHMAEESYQTGITYLEDVLTKSSDIDSKTEARELYCNMERAFRNARTRATRVHNSVQAEYDDISWWNIFKIFKKLDLRGDLKRAEKDLQELTDLHNLFNPSLLLPDAYAEPPVDPSDGDDTAGSDTNTDTDNDNSSDDNDNSADDNANDNADDNTNDNADDANNNADADDDKMDKEEAYDILQEDIAQLIALIPDEKLDQVAEIVSVDGSPLSTTSAPSTTEATASSTVGSELTTDTTDEVVSAPSDTVTTTAIQELPTTVVGQGDEVVAISEDDTATTTTTEVADDGAAATVGTTEVASTEPTEQTTGAPAAPTSTVIMQEQEAAPVVKSVAELKRDYISAYQNYIRATQSGDPAAVQEAMNSYRNALSAYNSGQANNNAVSTSNNTGPSAPGSTPSAPLNQGTNLGSGSVTTTDRIGRLQVGNRNQGQVNSRVGINRRSLRRPY